MPTLSGKTGEISLGGSTIVAFTDLELEYGSEPQPYFAVSGAGAQETVAGADAGSGTFNVVVRTDPFITETLVSGSVYAVTVTYTSGQTATGNARLGKFNWSMNRDGTVQRARIPFMTDGAWTFPS